MGGGWDEATLGTNGPLEMGMMGVNMGVVGR